jgi:hypothetical protein
MSQQSQGSSQRRGQERPKLQRLPRDAVPKRCSKAQLSAMGYNGDLLKAEFKEDHINKQKETTVTVTNTLARQQALAKAKIHGKKFLLMGEKMRITMIMRLNISPVKHSIGLGSISRSSYKSPKTKTH